MSTLINDEQTMKEKIFTTWKFRGVNFLAHPWIDNSIQICDENGNNYGSWLSLDNFRAKQQVNDRSPNPLGAVTLQFHHVHPANLMP